ncbi:60S ribosomal protein L29-like [Myotis lucifugus]|uniref:60S ribosomal protein L29-like n=1 Tax=Myotis lucifugus TaxID=59463 RepID=UPI0003C4A4E4|nr:60S ribosomal protein L29-like [Myotis lucifugus]
MAKTKNHTTYNQSRKWHNMASKKPDHKDTNLLRNMRFAKKRNKKGLRKMQANNAKALGACAEAIKALIKPNTPKGRSHKLSQLAYIADPKLGKRAHARIAKSLGLCQPKAKATDETKPQAAAPAAARAPTPKGAQAPTKAPQ